MPTIMVQSPPLEVGPRSTLAATLTKTAVDLANVPREKVKIFFLDKPGVLGTLTVLAIDFEATATVTVVREWETAFRRVVRDGMKVAVHLCPPHHAAKGGVLRSELPAATPTEDPQ
jgi:hypothetical protein